MSQFGPFEQYDPRTLGLESKGWKEMSEISKELAKVRPESWRHFKESVKGIGQIISSSGIGGGIRGGFQTTQRQLGAQIGFGITSAMQPFTNQMSNFVNRMTVASQPFWQRNAMGAGIGGIVGSIIGSFIPVPGATIAVGLLGAFVGASIEEGIVNNNTSITNNNYTLGNSGGAGPSNEAPDDRVGTGGGYRGGTGPGDPYVESPRGIDYSIGFVPNNNNYKARKYSTYNRGR